MHLPQHLNRQLSVQQTNSQQSTTEEGGLATPFVSMSDDEAIALVQSSFSIDGCVTRLATEKDDTFRVDADDGQRYILKVANPSETFTEISLQTDLLDHVKNIDPTIPIPRVLADRQGRVLSDIVDSAEQFRFVRLMTFLDGIPLDSTISSEGERELIGEALARLRLATEGFSHEGESRVLAWDVQHLSRLTHLLDNIDDSKKRQQLQAGMERFATLKDRIARLRKQVLHNDFNKSNIVVDHADPKFVKGIIDFGDTVRTAIAIDVSTALLNQLPRNAAEQPVDDLFSEGRDLLRGYLRVADLTAEEVALIPHLTMGRVVARALLTLWRAQLFPHNRVYILRNTEPGWAQLDWFLARSVDDVSDTLLPITA
jgi:hydroxylysine kinase